MKPKIIVADDSLTIQKVIKITLANEDFELIECTSDSTLNQLIQEHSPILVLLDFNLSENKTGYDLAKEIRSQGVPKIFMLYGTFDTIDENLLDHSGVSAHIVKPFEGTKFITQCRQLVEDAALEAQSEDFEEIGEHTGEFPAPIDSIGSVPDPIMDDADQWVMNQPAGFDEHDEDDNYEDEYVSDEIVAVKSVDSLHSQMQDWGIDVPGIIGETSDKQYMAAEFPPVIEEEEIETSVDNFVENDAPEEKAIPDVIELNLEDTGPLPVIETTTEAAQEQIPASDDLEYPDVDMIKSTIEAENIGVTSKLISVADLAEENTEEVEDDSHGTSTDEEIRDLEAQIADEVEEDIWAADEVIEDLNEANSEAALAEQIEEVTEAPQATKELEIEAEEVTIIKKEDPVQPTSSSFDIAALSEDQLMHALGPVIEKLVQKRVDEIIERIAWEVIPDLSENLIKKELEKISQTIIDSQK